MTKEIVELPDRKSGDINEIRDKKIALAKNATAQSDLPQQLEYLIKNGQTGEFMNVLDSYINEKIRSALGSLIASLDKGAAGTTKAIACIDTNNDLGIINPANLASVLGGIFKIEYGRASGSISFNYISGILIVGTTWSGGNIYTVRYNGASKIGGGAEEVSVSTSGYTTTITGTSFCYFAIVTNQ